MRPAQPEPTPSLDRISSAQSSENLILFSSEDGVYRITLNRPNKRNAINTEMAIQFEKACARLSQQGATTCIIDAAGETFTAGADTSDPQMSAAFARFYNALATTPVIWIACVSGGIVGAGVAIVAIAPVVVAGPDTWASLPEIKQIGRFPTGVVEKAGPYVDRRWLISLALSGEKSNLLQCIAGGLITDAVERGLEHATAVAWAGKLAKCNSDTVSGFRSAWMSHTRVELPKRDHPIGAQKVGSEAKDE